MAKKVVTFGEIMLRLSPPAYLRLIQTDSLNVTFGGGEANVAASLANFGMASCFVSKVPDNPLGQAAVNHLRRFGVDVDYVQRGGDRLGIYFAENGASQRPSVVVYDRAGSALAGVQAGEIPWREVFADKDWFHFTGITPALSEEAAEATLEAVKIAGEMGLTVSCDLNFRKKLWTTKKANQVMSRLMPYVHVAVGNEEDAEKVFGIKSEGSDITGGKLSGHGYQQVASQLVERFGFKYVAITMRESYSASDNGWSALLYDGRDFFKSREYRIHVVDRVGGGDSFCAALIYGLMEAQPPGEALEFAVAASCLKQTIMGDFNHVSSSEVMALVRGDGSGRVQR